MRPYLLLILSILSLLETLPAQTAPPNGMLYQAIARDASGNLAVRRTIYVRTSIIKTSATGTVMYSDEHKVTSNADAMFTVVVGQGSFLSGSYRKISDIPWGDDKYFFNLKISVAPSLPGSSWKPTYTDMGTSQFWSVPYALFSGAANNSRDSLTLRINGNRRELKLGSYRPVFFSVADNDSVANNEIQTLSRNGGRLLLSLNGGMVFLPDSSASNEIQNITRSGGRISLSLGGGTITLPDSSSTNELQAISRTGGRITLSQGGGTVSLPDSSASNELQAISKTGSTVTLSQGGGSFNDDDNQNLSITGSGSSKRIGISGGNSITLNISDADSSSSNELQSLTRNGGRLSLSQGGGTIALPDSNAANELQGLSQTGGRISLSQGGGTVFMRDSSSSNELQSISQSGNTITLSQGGGSVTITDNDQQQLGISAGKGTISLSNGGRVQLADSSASNELQSLSRIGGRISLNQGGGTIALPDSSATNELQTISQSGNTITLSQGGGSATITDNDKQTLSISGSGSSKTLSVSGGNSVVFNVSDADSSKTNELQTISKSGSTVTLSQSGGSFTDDDKQTLSLSGSGSSKTLSISGGNSVTVNVSDSDSSVSNELQTISQTGGRISLSQGGGTVFMRDSSSSNELQSISQSGNTITLSQGGGSVTITDNDQQQLGISAGKGTISLSDGGRVQLADSSASNELQSLTRTGGRISLNQGGGTIALPDSSATNELQTISQSGNTITLSQGGGSATITDNDKQTLSINGSGSSKTLSISGGNSVVFNVSDADSSRTNELQSLSQTGGRINLSQGGGTVFLRDSSATNELQTISKSGSTVTLSQSGGSFTDDDKQTLSVSGGGSNKTLSISGGNSVTVNVSDADSSVSNELQKLSLNGTKIELSNGGGSVDLTNIITKQPGSIYNPKRSIDTARKYSILQGVTLPVILNHFGDGSNGYKKVANNEILTSFSNFNTLIIPIGVTAKISPATTTVIYVKDTLFLLGTIDGGGGSASTFTMNATYNHMGATASGAFGDGLNSTSLLSGTGGQGFRMEWTVDKQPSSIPNWGGIISIPAGTQTQFVGMGLCGDPTNGNDITTSILEKVMHFGSDISGGNGWGLECCNSRGKLGGGEGGGGLYLIAKNVVFSGSIKTVGGNGGYVTCPCGSNYRMYSAAAGGGSCILRTDNLISASGVFDGSGGSQVNPWGCPNRIGGSGGMIIIKP